jgi:protein TonB
MYAWHPPRTLSAGASVAIVAALFGLLLLGLNIRQTAQNALHLVSVELSPPPPQPREIERKAPVPHARKPAPKHEASPRNIRNQATAVVVPPAPPLIPPPPVVTAPKAGVGAAANNGAAIVRGPGQGAGGVGNGLGGGGLGGEGNGDGDGEAVVGPRQTGGKLKYQDLPEGVLALGQEGTVAVLFAVEADGRASRCRVEHSSGYPTLDSLACRLIEQRFRFKPAKDRFGRPVRSWVEESHTWVAREE